MPKKLKSHVASFKFKVVLESLTTNNVAETARKYGFHANQLSTWRGYFLEHGPSIFQMDVTKREQELEKQITMLEQLLGKKRTGAPAGKKYLDYYASRAGNSLSRREC